MTSAPSPTILQRILLAVVPVVVLCGAGEAGARAYYYHIHHGDLRYLVIPFGSARTLHAQAEYPVAKSTYTKHDACSNREITYTVNAQGGRGTDWTPAKPPGTMRLLAVGASTTFGVNNPDGATWPALLEEELQRRARQRIEVLNGSQSSITLNRILELLSTQWLAYHPDVVLYYEAYNDTPYTAFRDVDLAITRFHVQTWLGQWANRLYYRSMLYTYLVEKLHFHLAAKRRGLAPQLARYRTQLRQLIRLLRDHGVTPVFVLQLTQRSEEAVVRRLRLEDEQEVQSFVQTATQRHGSLPADQLIGLRVYATQLFVEAVRREAEAAGVQVIDPRPAFAGSDAGLFCDEIHLTDAANRRLAQQIAAALDVSRSATP